MTDLALLPLFADNTSESGLITSSVDVNRSVQARTADVIRGTRKSETIDGTGKRDTIKAGKGKDTVNGKGGNDVIEGGGGDDTLNGNSGNDELLGGKGDDVLEGGSGEDILDGGDGIDTASYATSSKGVVVYLMKSSSNKGSAKGDEHISIENLIGSSAADELVGDFEDNVIDGGGGKDAINGNIGDDTIYGGGGKDFLEGGRDDDMLFGGNGKDTISGDAGADVIEGGQGADKLTGWGQDDTFVYRAITDSTVAAKGRDVIEDFDDRKDVIDLTLLDADTGTSGDDGFIFVGAAEFSGTAGELRYVKDAEATLIYGDVNGDAVADFAIQLTGAMDLSDDAFLL